MARKVLYYKNDCTLWVKGLHDAHETGSGKYLNAGVTVEVELEDDDGNAVTGQSWPASLTYDTGSDGDWYANLENDIDVLPGDTVYAIVTATAADGKQARWKEPLEVVERGAP